MVADEKMERILERKGDPFRSCLFQEVDAFTLNESTHARGRLGSSLQMFLPSSKQCFYLQNIPRVHHKYPPFRCWDPIQSIGSSNIIREYLLRCNYRERSVFSSYEGVGCLMLLTTVTRGMGGIKFL